MDEIAKLEAAIAAAKKQADEAGGTDESLNQALADAEAALEAKKAEGDQDVDYKKELENVAKNLPPPQQRSERDKAKYTVNSIFERFPDLKEEITPDDKEFDDRFSKLEQSTLRNQVEGIIRQSSKNEDEVKYKMYFYDNRVVKTGNIFTDADDAVWLAGKERTRNTLNELKRTPPSPGSGNAPGQKPTANSAPALPAEQVRRLVQLGLRQVAPDRWEGKKIGLQYNKQTKEWEQILLKK